MAEAETETERLIADLRAWVATRNISQLARSHGISSGLLYQFARGKPNVNSDTLVRLEKARKQDACSLVGTVAEQDGGG